VSAASLAEYDRAGSKRAPLRAPLSKSRCGFARLVGLVVSGALAAFVCCDAALGSESERGLNVVQLGDVWPYATVLAPDGSTWFAGSEDLTHVTADGRVVRHPLPVRTDMFSMAWGPDGALWAIDEDIGGVIRITSDGRYSRYRDLWATPDTLYLTSPPTSIIAGPDGTVWYADREQPRIMSVASDGTVSVVARLGRSADPELLASGPDGSVWFLEMRSGALARRLPDGRIHVIRSRGRYVSDGTVAPNGDFWFIRLTPDTPYTAILRTEAVRIDAQGRVTSFKAPALEASSIAVAVDGTVWIAGLDGMARKTPGGRFERIRRARAWEDIGSMVIAPDGRLWLIFGLGPVRAGWLPPDPCVSRRQITLHLRSRRVSRIRSATVAVQGQPTRRYPGAKLRIPVDLRGYLPGEVQVTIRVRTANGRYTRHRLFHTCATAT
jgi:virginiamycin B lyase